LRRENCKQWNKRVNEVGLEIEIGDDSAERQTENKRMLKRLCSSLQMKKSDQDILKSFLSKPRKDDLNDLYKRFRSYQSLWQLALNIDMKTLDPNSIYDSDPKSGLKYRKRGLFLDDIIDKHGSGIRRKVFHSSALEDDINNTCDLLHIAPLLRVIDTPEFRRLYLPELFDPDHSQPTCLALQTAAHIWFDQAQEFEKKFVQKKIAAVEDNSLVRMQRLHERLIEQEFVTPSEAEQIFDKHKNFLKSVEGKEELKWWQEVSESFFTCFELKNSKDMIAHAKKVRDQ